MRLFNVQVGQRSFYELADSISDVRVKYKLHEEVLQIVDITINFPIEVNQVRQALIRQGFGDTEVWVICQLLDRLYHGSY